MSEVHAWATGQDDNIGDTLLRRALLSHVGPGHRLSLFVGRASDDFVKGLGVPPESRAFWSFPRWAASAARAALRGRSVLLLNAGEVAVSRRGGLRIATLVPVIWLTRARGGHAAWVGAASPVLRPGWIWVYRLAARACAPVSWRDRDTQRLMRRGALVADLGFGLGTPVEQWAPVDERHALVVSLRGDRPPPTDEWLGWVRDLAAEHDLRILVVSQVGTDASRGEQLARSLGGDALPWRGNDHLANEEQVREVYARSSVVISDRLHVLVVAATEGAIPLGWVESGRGKVRRHFDSIGLGWVGSYDGDRGPLPSPDSRSLTEYSAQLARAVRSARSDLRIQAGVLRSALGPRS